MGFRTVVMLNNDLTHEWMNNPSLGLEIARSLNDISRQDFRYGKIVECTHQSNKTLVVLDGYTQFTPLSHSSDWRGPEDAETVTLRLLKEAAAAMGYRLAKK